MKNKITEEEAIKIARKYNLEEAYLMARQNGYSVKEALEDWDLI